MILVITNNSDQVTSRICMWLLHYKKRFRIISSEDEIEIGRINNGSAVIKNITRKYSINLVNIKKVLYRQGDFKLTPNKSAGGNMNLLEFLKKERQTLHDFLCFKLEQVEHFGHPQHADLNKLILLEKAVKSGLAVPEYLFTGSKRDLLEFNSRYPQIISKTILPGYHYKENNKIHTSFTELVSKEEINGFSGKFHPVFFQRFIPKKFDLRMFYLNNEFFSIAIVSQNNGQTKVDCRVYDLELRNRNIAFKVPASFEEKLRVLVNSLDLKYCSVDLVYGQDEKFYFLEINPIGQFGNVSYFGNYHLEKKMAELLCA